VSERKGKRKGCDCEGWGNGTQPSSGEIDAPDYHLFYNLFFFVKFVHLCVDIQNFS